MSDPWQLYDVLIDGIDDDVTVTAGTIGLRWCRVTSDEGGIGMALSMPNLGRPPSFVAPTFVGARLKDVAGLAKSWNFAEAGIGMAAINAWYAHPDRANDNGFRPCAVNTWPATFQDRADEVAGKKVGVIGHFGFAPAALSEAAEVFMLERSMHTGDYPDSACEYLLPTCDFVFISGSAFVNKTAPRLLDLSRDATTIFVGPSTPPSPVLLDHGADVVTGFVSTTPSRLDEALDGITMEGMYAAGQRVELAGEDPAATTP